MQGLELFPIYATFIVEKACFAAFLIMCTQLHRQHWVQGKLLSDAAEREEPESKSWLLFIEWSLLFYLTAWTFESIEENYGDVKSIYEFAEQHQRSRFSRLCCALKEWRECRTVWKWLDLLSLSCSVMGALLRVLEWNISSSNDLDGLGLCGRSKFCSDQVVTVALLLNWMRLFELLSIDRAVGPLIQM